MDLFVDVENAGVLASLQMLERRVSPLGLNEFLRLHADPYLQLRVRARFANEGDDAVGQWLPLSQTTEHIRASMGYGPAHPINVRSRQMLNEFMTSRADVVMSGMGAILTFPGGGMSSSVANKISVAQGGKANPATPARPVLALSATDSITITADLAKYMTTGLMGITL